ncbi:hypothetical protein Tco_0684770 [Tanacetum coccineum]
MWNVLLSILTHLGMTSKFGSPQQLKHMLANYGKCAGLKCKKPKGVDNEECESSKHDSKKGASRKDQAEMPSFPDGDDYADESTSLFTNHLEHQESEMYTMTRICPKEDLMRIICVCLCESLLTLPKEVKSLRGRISKLESIIQVITLKTNRVEKEESLNKFGPLIEDLLKSTSEDEPDIKDRMLMDMFLVFSCLLIPLANQYTEIFLSI